jgi:hypothetical protein
MCWPAAAGGAATGDRGAPLSTQSRLRLPSGPAARSGLAAARPAGLTATSVYAAELAGWCETQSATRAAAMLNFSSLVGMTFSERSIALNGLFAELTDHQIRRNRQG